MSKSRPRPPDLFAASRDANLQKAQPLAARLRPRVLDDFVGQEHFLGPGKLLRRLLAADRLSSLIFHGPPGSGKTSLAHVIANQTRCDFHPVNAVAAGIKDLREVIQRARAELEAGGPRSILFIDEIHPADPLDRLEVAASNGSPIMPETRSPLSSLFRPYEVRGRKACTGDAVQSEDDQLPYLETFSKAAELTSFTGAAKALGLTQAAVSQRIQALEQTLRKSLFQRRGGRVMLTEAGQTLYLYAQRILDLHREARREIIGFDAPVAGELLIASSSIPGEHLLPALLSVFGQRYPHIRVRASVSDSVGAIGQVERGEVSLGLVGRKVEKPHLEYRFLVSDRMVLVVPPGHVSSKRKKVTLKQLIRYPLVMRESGSGLRHCFEKSLERAGRSLAEIRVALELGSNEAIKEAVLRGVGVAILSNYAVQKELRSGQLHALEVSDLHCDRELFVVQDKRRVLSFPARSFLIFLETSPLPDPSP
jgi:LysR family transcriptional regulator, low CO2-responsive transcriptional regulator